MKNKFMKLAKKESEKSSHFKFNVGCVIVKKNKVLVKGHNIDKTHPRFGSNDWGYLHAETYALYKAECNRINLTGANAYIYRKGGRLARPCPTCEKMLKAHGIKHIYFTDHRK